MQTEKLIIAAKEVSNLAKERWNIGLNLILVTYFIEIKKSFV